MKLGDITKCPFCGSTIAENSITFRRTNLVNESDQHEDYFAGDNEKLCRKTDNIFAKGYCSNCQKNVELMILVDIKPIKCYSAGDRSDICMIDGDPEDK